MKDRLGSKLGNEHAVEDSGFAVSSHEATFGVLPFTVPTSVRDSRIPTTSGKEAIAFVLDSSGSMNRMVESIESSHESRFQLAKSLISETIASYITLNQDKNTFCIIVVVGANETKHHLQEFGNGQDVLFPNVLELNGYRSQKTYKSGGEDGCISEMGMMRPSTHLLQDLQKVDNANQEKEILSNFCDGVIVAADSLHRHLSNSTQSRYVRRRLLIFTDADSPIHSFNPEQMQVVLEGLQQLSCQVEVIGIDFDPIHNLDFSKSSNIIAEDKSHDRPEERTFSRNSTDDQAMESNCASGSIGADAAELMSISSDASSCDSCVSCVDYKEENIKLLISIAQITRGSVVDATTFNTRLQQLIHTADSKSTLRKMELHIAPALSISARFSLCLKEATLQRLKRQVIMLDETEEKPLCNTLGEEMLSDIQTTAEHYDKEGYDAQVVEVAQRTTAFRYGSVLIPMDDMDGERMKYRSGNLKLKGSAINMSILGYRPQRELQLQLLMGPPYYIVAGTAETEHPERSANAIASLGQAMDELHKYAICSFIKSKNADPIIGVLLPLPLRSDLQSNNSSDAKSISKYALSFVQMPYSEEVLHLELPSLQSAQQAVTDQSINEGLKTCYNLIDSLMIDPKELNTTQVPNPCISSVIKTTIKRTTQKDAIQDIEVVRPTLNIEENKRRLTQETYLSNMQKFLNVFAVSRPINEIYNATGRPTKKTRLYWSDALENS